MPGKEQPIRSEAFEDITDVESSSTIPGLQKEWTIALGGGPSVTACVPQRRD